MVGGRWFVSYIVILLVGGGVWMLGWVCRELAAGGVGRPAGGLGRRPAAPKLGRVSARGGVGWAGGGGGGGGWRGGGGVDFRSARTRQPPENSAPVRVQAAGAQLFTAPQKLTFFKLKI